LKSPNRKDWLSEVIEMPDTVSAENEQQQKVSLLSLPSHGKSSETSAPRPGVAAWLSRRRKWVLLIGLGVAAALIALIVPLAVILPRKRSHGGQTSDVSPPFTILIENLVVRSALIDICPLKKKSIADR
jgi:flagellar biosynthesis/type III secretory pathway M-ring protein FliF/YscJ